MPYRGWIPSGGTAVPTECAFAIVFGCGSYGLGIVEPQLQCRFVGRLGLLL